MCGVALVCPAPAGAHGLIQRSNLPLPEWLFGWAAAVVLVASFVALAVLWPEPKLEHDGWRPLPRAIGRTLGASAVQIACGAAGVALLVLVLVAGFGGSPSPTDNFAPTFVFITFWVGLVFASALLGDVFRAFNPWLAIGRAAGRIVSPARRDGWRHRPYPKSFGRWPAVAGLLGFTWIELASGWGDDPRMVAGAALGYTALTLAAQAVYGTETWTRRGEAFSVYFNLFSRISVFDTRDGVIGVRRPLGGLPHLEPLPGTVAFVLAMIGTVTFDGLSQGQLWKDAAGDALVTSPVLANTVGLGIGVAIVAALYSLGIAGARSVGGDLDGERLRRGFVHSLVPIALVYVAAHYLTFLLFEGQAIAYLASDPLGRGWDLFGTASSAIDYGLIGQNQAWYAQVGFVVAGHVAALALAHDRALAMYGPARLAIRSQYWMLGTMVGFTMLALWLLAQAGG